MSAPDELRTAAERLEERARDNDGEAAWHIQRGGHGTTWLRHAAEDRAVAALLQAIDDAGPSIDDDEERIVHAALAVARVVVGDPT